jgi:hypothetical protein
MAGEESILDGVSPIKCTKPCQLAYVRETCCKVERAGKQLNFTLETAAKKMFLLLKAAVPWMECLVCSYAGWSGRRQQQ